MTLRIDSLCLAFTIATAAFGQVYSNGPVITGLGNGYGGANTSSLAANLSTFGYLASLSAGNNNRLADDFTVPCGQTWALTEIRAFAFQTQTVLNTISTLTAANYRIWDGPPGDPSSTVLHDHGAGNQMAFTSFMLNCYRVDSLGNPLLNVWPIFTAHLVPNGIVLPPGRYWLDLQLSGSLTTGPWIPPITITGTPATGDAYQFLSVNGAPNQWGTVPIMSGYSPNFYPQGMPFEIHYNNQPTPCFDATISQPGGPGTGIFVSDVGGLASATAVNAITTAPGAYPNGWLFGLDIPLTTLVGEIQGGPPFNVTLDASGVYQIGPIPPPPFPIQVWYVGLELIGASLIAHSEAKTVTIMP